MDTHPSHRAIAAAIAAGVPAHIEGSPGEAKTASLTAWGTQWGRQVEVVTGSSRDKGDFMGMPVEADGKVVYSPPAWVRRLQTAKAGLLVLDELQSSSESFAISMRIVQERAVGEAPLPETTSIVAISNPVDEAVDGQELPAPVANRFLHIDWYFDFDAWAEGMLTDFAETPAPALHRILAGDDDEVAANRARIQGSVLAFLTRRPDLRKAVPTDLTKAGKGWPSPRSWTNAIRAMAQLKSGDEDARDLVLRGCVGEQAMVEYLSWLATSDLHDPAEVMADPSIIDWSGERPDRLFALVSSVRSIALSSGDVKTWKQAMAVMTACAEGGKPDVATPGARSLFSRMPKGARVPAAASAAFEDMFAKIGGAERARI
ncbi:ATP-binding protein [Pseudactinotalea sp. Z1748]|uniref:ATP-binding protein n=1 Tax=Pseudactinotalea sp. Z1748 TaxID=3413027 RepID=UPI003C7E6D6D